MTPLLALGPHVFEIAPFNYQQIQTVTEAKWPATPRFGKRPGRQFTGLGEDTIVISGLLYPDELGGREELDALRMTQKAALPVMMIGWSSTIATAAKVFGRVAILRIEDSQSSINRQGQGRRIEFSIEIAPIGDSGKPVGLFG